MTSLRNETQLQAAVWCSVTERQNVSHDVGREVDRRRGSLLVDAFFRLENRCDGVRALHAKFSASLFSLLLPPCFPPAQETSRIFCYYVEDGVHSWLPST